MQNPLKLLPTDDFPLLEDDPDVIHERLKLTNLQLKKIELENEINSTASVLSEDVKKRKSRREAAADQLISTGSLDINAAHAYEQTLQKSRAELKVVNLAIEKQRQILISVESKTCREICKTVLPRYRELTKGVADALINLADAVDAERKFNDKFREHGVSRSYLRGPAVYVGLREEDLKPDNRLFWFFRSLIEDGLLRKSDIPSKYVKQLGLDCIREKTHELEN